MNSDRQGDEGYFPRGRSILRQVQDERLVGLFYGQRALCVGALSPLNYVGTSEHTKARDTPWTRLVRTGKSFETVYFGTRAQADRVLASVRNVHEHVSGGMPEDAGPIIKGTPYSALDPELMLWTVAVLVDSAQRFYELFVRRLSDRERDILWQEWVRFGALFGLPPSSAPSSYHGFRAWWNAQLASERLCLTDEARQVGYEMAFAIPLPRRNQPAKRVHDLIMLGCLPPRARELYGLSYTQADAAKFRVAVAVLRAGRRAAPARVVRGPSSEFFGRVQQTERWRIEHGVPTPQLWSRPPASYTRSSTPETSSPAPDSGCEDCRATF